MASRGSAVTRAVKYFREADVDEMRVAFALVKEVVEGRLHTSSQVPKAVRRGRKPRVNSPESTGVPTPNIQRETLSDA
jgi:hypothetical protein